MSYFELLQESPALFFLALIFSLILTLIVYGAFPVIFAKTRKTPITKKKYKRLCYGINFIGIFFFFAFNGAASAAPYMLWTWIFSNYGIKTLETKKLLSDLDVFPTEVETSTPDDKIRFCRRCGSDLGEGSRFCRKCGTEIKEE